MRILPVDTNQDKYKKTSFGIRSGPGIKTILNKTVEKTEEHLETVTGLVTELERVKEFNDRMILDFKRASHGNYIATLNHDNFCKPQEIKARNFQDFAVTVINFLQQFKDEADVNKYVAEYGKQKQKNALLERIEKLSH